ncbi:MAG: hypothetical protein B7X02_00145 [Rhodospirillales bacterium 12-54-5]|nr:MAG: hypothetical protein B7X02_00145 [Rhodospirillales bacterium 12-54-5]
MAIKPWCLVKPNLVGTYPWQCYKLFMFRCKKNPDKIVAMASLLILGGVIPLCVALIAQYNFGLHPCHYCLLQRYPYGVVILCGILSLLVTRAGLAWRVFVALGICGWLATGTLGLVHTAIEAGILTENSGCVAGAATNDSVDALRNAILNAPIVACNEVAARFLGLSMATWNAIGAALLIMLACWQYRFDVKRYDTQLRNA